MPITLQPVTRDNWRECAAVSVPAGQQLVARWTPEP